ncbi:hybrid sensor histidine kinase/response regulator [Hyalangium sp.]|uniref:hybrid sensor histidine kinase/response regulator n=1 Tax=Hyalangium sp. TaxID=2028555 RepID=UPI002D4312D1|nr:ATP-binding protein [Hyalangium sp.]HYH96385.1 ATP-binding protein [Hyalangium sp.]
MQVLLLKVPPPLDEELERCFLLEGGKDLSLQVRRAERLEELPESQSPSLVVLGDPGGPLEELVALCRQLRARRSCMQTHLTVLTRRASAELAELARAGADECQAPPGESWGVRLIALRRRLCPEDAHVPDLARLEKPRLSSLEALYVLLSSTSAEIGHDFFQPLVSQLASALRVSIVLVGELVPGGESLQTLTLWVDGGFRRSVTWPVLGSPHQQVVTHGSCHVVEGVQARFPRDPVLQQLNAVGFLGVALKDAQQKPIGVLAVAHTEPLEAGLIDYALMGALGARAGAELARIHVQSELERTRDFLRNILNALPDPVFVKDRAHRFVVLNTAFCRVIGRTEDMLLGMSDYDVVPAQEADVFWKKDEEVFASGQPNENEETLTDGLGSSRTLLTKKAPFTGVGGEPFLVGIIRDVTEWRRLEMQLRLTDRMASVGMLAAGVAHEINNPLAYLSSNLTFISEQLARQELTAAQLTEVRDAVRESLEGAGRVRVIVQDLKSFARADEATQGPVDVHRVIHGALRLVRNEFNHRARLTCTLDPVAAAHGNEARLGQVLVNLLVNALQAFPPARSVEDNSIRISTRSREEWIVIEVEDNGQGMTPEVQERIFEPFFTTKPVGIGTGLGLSICNNLIRIMGGWIEVHSKPGWGSNFRLVLPAFTAKTEAAVATGREKGSAQMLRRKVLLIDDEPAVGTAVRRLLRDMHEVEALQDAREALKRIASGTRYDAIVCDVMMPEMNGVQFFQELERSAPELARRTGLMSGGVFSPQAMEFIESRAVELLHKPFERESLRQFVERLCGGASA